MGMVFGAPVVASELEHSTNRLVWTQSVSRTRWLLTKWAVVLAPLVVFITILTVVAQWWTGHVFLELYAETLFGVGQNAAVLLRDDRHRADRLHPLRLRARCRSRRRRQEDGLGRRRHRRHLRCRNPTHGLGG